MKAIAPAMAFSQTPQPKAGCQANGFPLKPGDFPALLAALEKMRELGYTGFECNQRFVRGQFGRAVEARKEIEKTGVRFVGAHTSMAESKPEAFPETLAGLQSLGVDAVVMSGAGLAPDGKFEEPALRAKATALEAFGKQCRAHGIRLAYHNHNPEFANHNAEIEGLAKYTSSELVDFLMDAGHGYLGGGNPAEFMAKHSKRIFGCHIKTFRGKNASGQVPLGEGDFDFVELAAEVKKAAWAGWLIVEEGGGPQGGNTAAVGPDRKYLRKLFGI